MKYAPIRSNAKGLPTIFAAGLVVLGACSANAQSLTQSDILVVGDSQVAFHGGGEYVLYFKGLSQKCGAFFPDRKADYARFLGQRVGVLGVRATSIDTWVARSAKGKAKICTPEKSWPVNARGFGVLHNSAKKFVQVGKDPAYPLCTDGRSAIETLFEAVKIKPKLLVFAFLGNSTRRWTRDLDLARKDAADLASQIPSDTPCVFMTTSPTFKMAENDKRRVAQQHFLEALKEQENGCRPVEGLTEKSISKIENMPLFFKRDKKGKVKDNFHPNSDGVGAFLETIGPNLCQAISEAVAFSDDATTDLVRN